MDEKKGKDAEKDEVKKFRSGQQFGVGNAAGSKAFGTTLIGEQVVELIHGEHPHSYSDNSIYARFPGGSIYDFDGHRVLTRVVIEEYNYIKESEYSGDEIRKGGRVRLFINGRQIGEDFVRSWERGIEVAKELHAKIMGHPMDLWDDPEKVRKNIEGRKVYYMETPAVLYHWMPDQCCVMVRAIPGHKFPLPAYAIDDREEDGDYEDERTSVKVEIFSDRLWWFRDRRWPGEDDE